MKQSPSWDAKRPRASRKLPHILSNPKFHYSFHKHPPSVAILSQINPAHASSSSNVLKFHLILFSHLRLGFPSGLFPSGLPPRTLYAPLKPPIRATCLAHLILLDVVTRMIFGEKYRSSGSWLRSFSPFPSYLVPLITTSLPQHPILEDLIARYLSLNPSISLLVG